MSAHRFDLIVIGSGPAGHHGAIQAAKLGKRVAIIERQKRVGGVCFNTGTIPSKTLREAVLYLSGFRLRGLYGDAYRLKQHVSMEDLLYRCHYVMKREVDVYRAQFARNGVELLQGCAEFADTHRIRLQMDDGPVEYETGTVLIATGTMPARSDNVPVDGKSIFDGDGLLDLNSIPRTMIVVGGGVIGMEYACMFAAMGTQVTLLDTRTRLLEFVDGEMIDALVYHMRDMGVTPRLGETLERVETDPDGGVIAYTESNKILRAETLLYSVGRQGNTAKLNLEAAGLKADKRGRLKVNEYFQTEVPHIYAAGDVVGFPSLASTSMHQGRVAAAHAFGEDGVRLPPFFPYGIYTIPEISFVGKTEEELTEDAVPYEFGVARYREIARGQIVGDTVGRLKLIFHRDTEELLGVHIIGEGASELVHIGQAVLSFGGTVRYFVDNIFNYPTLAECYKVAALHGLNRLGSHRSKKAA